MKAYYSLARFGRALGALACAWVLAGAAMGQSGNLGSIGNSPLSRLGLGELLPEGSSRQQAIGEGGVGAPSADHLNYSNPALLYYNRVTNFEFTSRLSTRTITDGTNKAQSSSWSPTHISLAFPIARFLTTAVGIRQYSAVDYAISFSDTVLGDANRQYTTQYNGNGTISRVFVGVGAKLFGGFTAGIRADYWLGTITKNSSALIDNFTAVQFARSRVNDVTFRPGLAWRGTVGKKGHRLGLGLTGDFSSRLTTTDELIAARYSGNTITFVDTLINERTSQLNSPASLQFGGMWEKPNHWSLIADIGYTQWRDVKGLIIQSNLKNTYKASVGAEWVPNINSGKYLNLVTYRAGFRYQQLPYELGGKQQNDYALTLAMGWPVMRKEARYTRPVVNTMVTLGRRGSTGTGGVAENYLNFTLGVVLNDNLWFVRYKID